MLRLRGEEAAWNKLNLLCTSVDGRGCFRTKNTKGSFIQVDELPLLVFQSRVSTKRCSQKMCPRVRFGLALHTCEEPTLVGDSPPPPSVSSSPTECAIRDFEYFFSFVTHSVSPDSSRCAVMGTTPCMRAESTPAHYPHNVSMFSILGSTRVTDVHRKHMLHILHVLADKQETSGTHTTPHFLAPTMSLCSGNLRG